MTNTIEANTRSSVERGGSGSSFLAWAAARLDPVVLLAIVVGLMVRAAAFGTIPPGIFVDEASSGYDAYALLHYGIDRNGFHNPVALVAFGSGMSALTSYVVMPFIALWGLNAVALRLPFLLLGVASIYLFALLVAELQGQRAARIAAWLLAICPWHIFISRWGHESHLLPGLLLIGVLAAVYSPRKPWLLPASFASFALALYAYAPAYFVVPILLGLTILYFAYHRRWSRWPAVAATALFVVMALPILLYVAVNAWRWESIVTPALGIPRLPSVPRFEAITAVRLWEPESRHAIVENLWGAGKLLITQNDGLVWNAMPRFGLVYLFSLPLAVLGFIQICRACWQRTFTPEYAMLAWCFTAVLLCAVVAPNANRLNVGLFPLVYCTARGLQFLCDRARWAFYAAAALYAASFMAFSWAYFTTYPAEAGPKFVTSLVEAIAAAGRDPAARVCVTERIEIPYIFALFAGQDDPRDFLATVQYANPGAEFQNVTSFGRYSFGLPPDDRPEIDAFVIVDGEVQFSRDEFDAEKFGYFLVLRRKRQTPPSTEPQPATVPER